MVFVLTLQLYKTLLVFQFTGEKASDASFLKTRVIRNVQKFAYFALIKISALWENKLNNKGRK